MPDFITGRNNYGDSSTRRDRVAFDSYVVVWHVQWSFMTVICREMQMLKAGLDQRFIILTKIRKNV